MRLGNFVRLALLLFLLTLVILPAAAQDVVELRILWYNDGTEGDALRTLLDQFEAENSDIRVIVDTIAYADIHTTLQAQVETGDVREVTIKGRQITGVFRDGRSLTTFAPEDNIIVGNVSLYGATGGEVFLRGQAGERFCVRNSGVTAVVEGVGDHGCEYMTRGLVVVLGRTGRNFAAGMSGGVAYVLDDDGTFRTRCNMGLVAVEALTAQDADTIRDLIQRHHDLTGSGVAARLLANWQEAQGQFLRVMPVEYAKVLTTQHLDTESARVAAI